MINGAVCAMGNQAMMIYRIDRIVNFCILGGWNSDDLWKRIQYELMMFEAEKELKY